MNSESIHLNMTPDEADKIAHVLMASLRKVSMLDSERVVATQAANNLFGQLRYSYRTDSNGNRRELDDRQKIKEGIPVDAKRVYPECQHPGLSDNRLDPMNGTRHCGYCGSDVPA